MQILRFYDIISNICSSFPLNQQRYPHFRRSFLGCMWFRFYSAFSAHPGGCGARARVVLRCGGALPLPPRPPFPPSPGPCPACAVYLMGGRGRLSCAATRTVAPCAPSPPPVVGSVLARVPAVVRPPLIRSVPLWGVIMVCYGCYLLGFLIIIS